jgi:RNA polymerase primary sigma factor
LNVEFDILDTEGLLREAEGPARESCDGTALDAYFVSLQHCPKIAPSQQIELAREYQASVHSCRQVLDGIPGRIYFLAQVLEQLLGGERLTSFFIVPTVREGPRLAGQPSDRFAFFKQLEEKSSLHDPHLADWQVRPNLILQWSRDLVRRMATFPQRPWISHIIPTHRRATDALERWVRTVRQLEAFGGLRITELFERVSNLRPHLEVADRRFATLVECNLKLSIHIAKKFQNRGVPLDDLVQEANLGLMKGIERFDASKGFNLSTYAVCWIKESIMRALLTQGHLIRFPPALQEMFREIQRIRDAAFAQGLGEPSLGELARQLNTSQQNVEAAAALYQIFSLHQPVSGSPEERYEQVLVGDEGITVNESATLRRALEQLLANLPSRERQIVRLRYGLAKGLAHTVEEVAEQLRMTRERVRQIEAKAISRMQLDPAVQQEKSRFLAA